MKPSLQLKFSQQLTMTPQLQQAIRLLQLSTLDLKQEIQEALDSNPLLELDEQSDPNTQDANGESRGKRPSATCWKYDGAFLIPNGMTMGRSSPIGISQW